jgi:hypothetical protein
MAQRLSEELQGDKGKDSFEVKPQDCYCEIVYQRTSR